MRKFRLLLIALSVVAVFASACRSGRSDQSATATRESVEVSSEEIDGSDDGSAPDETEDSEGDTDDGAKNSAADADDEADADDGGDGGGSDDAYLESESPLAEYMGFDFNNTEAMVEAQRQIDEQTQRCMRGQGFEFELASTTGSETFEDRGSMSDEEFAAEHGYGLADSMLERAARNTDGANPNLAAVQSMSETERAAWETAMYGQPLEEVESASVGPPGGCFGEAQAEVFGDFMVFQQLQPALETMQDEVAADPRVVAISERWATCMNDSGYNFASTVEARDAVGEMIDAFVTSTDPTALEPTEEEIQELEEIKQEEIKIASADVKCIRDDIEEMREINREYELKFIDENKATLEGANS